MPKAVKRSPRSSGRSTPKKEPRARVAVRTIPLPKATYRVPGAPESESSFDTLYKQTKGRRGITVVVSTRFSKKLEKKGSESSRTVKHVTFHEKIYRTQDVEFSSRKHYVKITRKDLSDAGNVKRAVAKVLAIEGKRFAGSKYDRMAASVQIVAGKILNADTGFVAKSGFSSKAIRMPAETRQRNKLKRETLKESTEKKVREAGKRLLDQMEEMAIELHGTNLKRRKPKPYKGKGAPRRSAYRDSKRNEGETMERAKKSRPAPAKKSRLGPAKKSRPAPAKKSRLGPAKKSRPAPAKKSRPAAAKKVTKSAPRKKGKR